MRRTHRQAPAHRQPPRQPWLREFDFTPVSQLMDDAVAAHRLPGAVVMIGHAGRIVFRRAFGSRKLAGEPGLDGSPARAEPMTEDTIFDLASLTKSVATTTAFLSCTNTAWFGSTNRCRRTCRISTPPMTHDDRR